MMLSCFTLNRLTIFSHPLHVPSSRNSPFARGTQISRRETFASSTSELSTFRSHAELVSRFPEPGPEFLPRQSRLRELIVDRLTLCIPVFRRDGIQAKVGVSRACGQEKRRRHHF